MHFVVAIFHEADSDPDSLMQQYSYDDEAYYVFEKMYDKDEAKNLFAEHMKENPKDDITLESFMRDYYECYNEDENGDFGNSNNPHGLYDWCSVGGRWANMLYGKVNEKQIKDKYVKDLNDYLVQGSKLKEYVRISNISAEKYIMEKRIFGHNTIRIKDLDEKTTLKMNSDWAPSAKKLGDLFEHVIDEYKEGVGSGEDFPKLMKNWKKIDGYITIIDCHT